MEEHCIGEEHQTRVTVLQSPHQVRGHKKAIGDLVKANKQSLLKIRGASKIVGLQA